MICYIDAFSGLAGDMLVAALADAGADREAITSALKSLATEGQFAWEEVRRRGMAAVKFRVTVAESPAHRHLGDILKVIDAAELPPSVKASATRVFQILGEAEAQAHGIRIEKVHFHEVGAVDSICDIVGICMGFHLLNIEKIYCSPINVGSGTVKTEHGVLPVPAPATARLLEGRPIYARGPAIELTTPTGAAIVAALAESVSAMPPMTIQSIGYGAGDHDFREHANIVRVMIGEPTRAPEHTTVFVIEANIDDASPQVIGWATEKLLEAGALDALVLSAQMKKNRPGVVLQVIAPPEKREELIALIFRETTTLGVRFYCAERRVQTRDWVEVTTAHGVVRVKTAPDGFAPEYEDARRIAAETGVPLKEILAAATHEYLKTR
ncbi:MAG TPA: nickel pincer cofactor biosynthesis protein LarC [Bryobacteraceae bacterium]|nr:nickel pincer cofactor biosynthesis protein LarC [Bryobacteraceae bacterium]